MEVEALELAHEWLGNINKLSQLPNMLLSDHQDDLPEVVKSRFICLVQAQVKRAVVARYQQLIDDGELWQQAKYRPYVCWAGDLLPLISFLLLF